MDEVDDDNFYGSKGLESPDSTTYHLYAFAATLIVGLPLLFVALYKIYMDHQHHQDKQYAYREKMIEYREAKQGLTVNLRHEVNATRRHYEMEKIEREHNDRQIRMDHGKQIRELESKVRTQESMLRAKTTEIEELIAEHRETLRKIDSEYSHKMQKAKHKIASLTSSYRKLNRDLEKERENVQRADERYEQQLKENRRDRETKTRRESELETQKSKLEDSLHTSQLNVQSLNFDLKRTKERLEEAQSAFLPTIHVPNPRTTLSTLKEYLSRKSVKNTADRETVAHTADVDTSVTHVEAGVQTTDVAIGVHTADVD